MARTLYGDDERFVETYWDEFGPDTYFVGDAARRDEDGYFWIVGRIDDVINVSGHRLSTMEVESAIVSHPKVAEAAVIGVPDEVTGAGDLRLRDARGRDRGGRRARRPSSATHVAEQIGKLARPKQIAFADDLPEDALGQDHAPPAARHRRRTTSSATSRTLRDPGRGRGPEAADRRMRPGGGQRRGLSGGIVR